MRYVIWKGNTYFTHSLPIPIREAASFMPNVLESFLTLFLLHLLSLPRTLIRGWKDQEGRNRATALPGIKQQSCRSDPLCSQSSCHYKTIFFFLLFKQKHGEVRINTAFRTDLVAAVLCKAQYPFTAKIEFNAYGSFDGCSKTTLHRSTFMWQILL